MEQPTLETLTPEQWSILRQLNHFVRNDLKFEPRELCYWFLLRFANARNFALEDTKKMLTDYAAFHNGIVARKVEHWGPDDPEYLDIQRNISLGFHYCAKTGAPVLIYRLGESKIKELLKKYTIERIVDYHVTISNRFLNIMLPICSTINKRRTEKLIAIIDFKNVEVLSYLSGKLSDFVKRFAEVGQLFYPNILANLYITNAPMLFSAFWSVAKYLLHPTTQERIEISSGSNKDKMLSAIDADKLPVWLGGTSQADPREMLGPWKAAIDESFKLKSFYLTDDSPFRDNYLTKTERRSTEKTESTIVLVRSATPKIFSSKDLTELKEQFQVRRVKISKMVVSMSSNNLPD